MAERLVLVPVSLIERVLTFQGIDAQPVGMALRALISQPTPSAEPNPWPTQGEFAADGTYSSVDTLRRRWKPVTPPSIADMAPGTTFEAALTNSDRVERWMRVNSCHPVARMRDGWHAAVDALDPSTIRDVTSPKETDA